MTVLSATQEAMAFLSIFIFTIEIYLLITNITYVFLKLRYFQPPLLEYSYARSYRRLAEFSRSGAILLLLMYSAMEVFWAGSRNISNERICASISRVPSIYMYLLLNCRVFFAYARFALFKVSLGEEHKKATAGVYLMLFMLLIGFISYQITMKHEYHETENVCFIKTNDSWFWIFIPIWLIYETASFALYYAPMKEIDGLSSEKLDGWAELLSTENQELGDFEEDEWQGKGPPAMDDEISRATIDVENSLNMELPPVRSTCAISQGSVDMICKFHKIVRRHFWAGVAINLTGTLQLLQFCMLDGTVSTSEFLGIPVNARTWYFQSGVAEVVCRGLGLILYISMMLSEHNSERAFIPYILWTNDSWEK